MKYTRAYDLMSRRDIDAALDRYFAAYSWAAVRPRTYAGVKGLLQELDARGAADAKFVR